MDYHYRRLRDMREDHDMTQQQVAEYLKIGRIQYFRYESGQREVPVHLLIRLALLYQTSMDYLVGLTNNPKPPKDIPE